MIKWQFLSLIFIRNNFKTENKCEKKYHCGHLDLQWIYAPLDSFVALKWNIFQFSSFHFSVNVIRLTVLLLSAFSTFPPLIFIHVFSRLNDFFLSVIVYIVKCNLFGFDCIICILMLCLCERLDGCALAPVLWPHDLRNPFKYRIIVSRLNIHTRSLPHIRTLSVFEINSGALCRVMKMNRPCDWTAPSTLATDWRTNERTNKHIHIHNHKRTMEDFIYYFSLLTLYLIS